MPFFYHIKVVVKIDLKKANMIDLKKANMIQYAIIIVFMFFWIFPEFSTATVLIYLGTFFISAREERKYMAVGRIILIFLEFSRS